MDEDFNAFLEVMGQPFYSVKVSKETIHKYRGRLPDKLLEYWQAYGFCGFHNGLFWIVNPEEYEGEVEDWLIDSPLLKKDKYYVIARSGFGDLFLWGEKRGYRYKVTSSMGWAIEQDGNEKDITKGKTDDALQAFFCCVPSISTLDTEDNNGKPLFERAVKKFGPLNSDEIFGFEPSLIVGGKASLKNIAKVNIHVHLSILAQFEQIEILDDDALKRKAFGG